MAADQITGWVEQVDFEVDERPVYRRLGLLNGFSLGLALAFGAWAAEAVSLARLPMRMQFPSLILAGLLLIIICSVTGWLSSKWTKNGLPIFFWLTAAVLVTLILAYQPSYGRNFVAWLSDWRFWGLPIYPYLDAPILPILTAGFAIFLVLIILAVLQNYRLEQVQSELTVDGQMSGRSWFLLLWPLVFVILAGYATNSIVGDKSARDALIVQEAINTGRTYEGDLFELALGRGVNYSAINGVREQMSAHYELLIGEVDGQALTTHVVANFDNGAWINCRIINGNLNYCYDAAPPYTVGLGTLISGEAIEKDCQNCMPQVENETAAWLRTQQEALGENPHIERLAQKGRYVLMRVTSASSNEALECWFTGLSPVKLTGCSAVND